MTWQWRDGPAKRCVLPRGPAAHSLDPWGGRHLCPVHAAPGLGQSSVSKPRPWGAGGGTKWGKGAAGREVFWILLCSTLSMHGFSSPSILDPTIISEPEEQGKQARKRVASPLEAAEGNHRPWSQSPSEAWHAPPPPALPFALLTPPQAPCVHPPP